MTRDSAEVECSLNFMGSHNSNISRKPFQKRVNATMDVVLMFLLLNLIRHLDTQSVLGNLLRKKTHFRKNVSDYRAYKQQNMGSVYYQSKADDLFWGYFTLIVKFARLTTLENRVTYIVATAEWPQKVSYQDGNRASLKTRKAWVKTFETYFGC